MQLIRQSAAEMHGLCPHLCTDSASAAVAVAANSDPSDRSSFTMHPVIKSLTLRPKLLCIDSNASPCLSHPLAPAKLIKGQNLSLEVLDLVQKVAIHQYLADH